MIFLNYEFSYQKKIIIIYLFSINREDLQHMSLTYVINTIKK